ncbi:glycosyltransferase family 4 protein [Terriglobus roseus]|uniref:Glycosyltransferase involved in cell wall bisynthesis n=1 Tax=Terriglobus roseus TaxID=392734 RepID=A0A1G7JZZ0_9BACT|nr:glycosyltransferase family 4 protein [Terriglobus roseus]SDF30119.1 Glycosyltransferase involved in cell wall bisynthesis [Terriglobus roseus]
MIAPTLASSPSGSNVAKRDREWNIWLSDAFCFTSWYSSALVKALLNTNASVRFITTDVAGEPAYFRSQGVTPNPGPFSSHYASKLPSPARRAARLLSVMANSAALRWQLKHSLATRPDVLHLQQLPALNHGINDDFRTIACAQSLGIPVVHTVHNLLPHDSGDSLRATYERLYTTVDRLICHSPDVAEKLTKQFGVNAHNISVIPHGPLFEAPIETGNERSFARTSLNIEHDRPVVLWQGVMAPYKGLDLLLQAWERCMSSWPDTATKPLLLIAGTGPASEAGLVNAAAKQFPESIRPEIRYITTAELPLFFQASDVLVYPYRAITTSGALLTGLTYRKPIIASDLAPFRQFLRNKENALLVPPGDVAAMTEALHSLLLGISTAGEASSIYRTLAAGAAQNQELYTSWDTIAKQTLSVYRELVRNQ